MRVLASTEMFYSFKNVMLSIISRKKTTRGRSHRSARFLKAFQSGVKFKGRNELLLVQELILLSCVLDNLPAGRFGRDSALTTMSTLALWTNAATLKFLLLMHELCARIPSLTGLISFITPTTGKPLPADTLVMKCFSPPTLSSLCCHELCLRDQHSLA